MRMYWHKTSRALLKTDKVGGDHKASKNWHLRESPATVSVISNSTPTVTVAMVSEAMLLGRYFAQVACTLEKCVYGLRVPAIEHV